MPSLPKSAPSWAMLACLLASPGIAQVARFEMEPPRPAFAGGHAYEVVAGRATIALDPADPRNAGIADITLAPRNAQGRVEASVDVMLLRPTDHARANGTILIEPPNRGRRIIGQLLLDTTAARTGQFTEATDAGNGWLLRQGYTLAWVAWQGDPTPGAGMRIRVPAPPGITGEVRDEFVFDSTTDPAPGQLTYPVADLASLRATMRPRAEAPRQAASLRFTTPDRIVIDRAGAEAGAIYEVTYTARDPGLMGMGLAAWRDVSAALRHGEGEGNPQAGRAAARAIALGVSQSGRFLRDVLYQGFNEDTAGRMVFDGMFPHIPGSRRSFTNARWAQPGRNPADHTDRGYPADQFPFTYADTTDPLTGRTDGLLRRCAASNTCPRIMQTDSEYEYWGARGSLTVTAPDGRHIELPANVRAYMMTGHPHYAAAEAWAARGAMCANPVNPLQAGAPMRALLVAMEAWIREGVEPPPSRTPSVAAGTLVPAGAYGAVSNAAAHGPGRQGGLVGIFRAIPGLAAPDSMTPAPLLGVAGEWLGRYPIQVPAGDADGNALGGIRLPVIEAPRATYTGYNPRATGFGEGALCGNTGSALAFPATATPGDPRMPIDTRWPSESYVAAVRESASRLVAQRLLLDEDAAAMVEAARAGTLARIR